MPEPSDVRGSASALRIRSIPPLLVVVATLLALLPAGRAAAVPGDLDPAFGRRGWVAAPFSSGATPYMAGYVGGKLVVGGDAISLGSGGLDFAFSRLDASGDIDPTYGLDGRALIDTPAPFEDFIQEKAIGGGFLADGRAQELAWDLSGSVIVFHLLRLTPDGTRDLSFGKRGVVVFTVPWAIGVPEDVVMDSQGRMYVTTYIERNNGFTLDLGVFRIKADGTLDKSFGTNGLAFANIDRQDEPNAIRLDPDGRIVVAGSTYDDNAFPVAHHVVVARFTAAGRLDGTFSGDGKVETPFSGDAEAWSVGFDASGRVLVGLRDGEPESSTSSAGVARYSAAGVLDGGFGSNGLAAMPVDTFGGFVTARGIAVAGGDVLVMGGGDGAFVDRYTSGGDPVAGWGGDGRVDIPNMDDGRVLLIRNGAPTVVGPTSSIDGRPVGTRMAAAEVTAAGVNQSFGDHGLASIPFYGTEGGEGAEAAVAAPGGGAFVGVGLTLTIPNAWGVLKLQPDGTPDPSFGDDGRVEVPSDLSVGPAGGIAVMPDGDVLLASSDNRAEILRFQPDGDLETSWGGGDGILSSDSMFAVDALAVRSDGGFYIAGEQIGNNGVQREIAVARFDSDGDPVASFGTQGAFVYEGTQRSEFVTGMVLDDQGRPNVVFSSSSAGDHPQSDIGFMRLTTAGVPDEAFGTHGRLLAGLQSRQATAGGLALDGGRLVASGTLCHTACPFGDSNTDAVALRVTSAGALDPTFDGDGFRSVDFGGSDAANTVHVDDQGRVVAGGGAYLQVNGRDSVSFAAARLLPGGGLDTGYGYHGVVRELPLSTYATITELVPQPDGDLLAIGAGLSDGVVATRLMGAGVGIGRRDVTVAARSVLEGDAVRKDVGVALRLSAPLAIPVTLFPFVDGGTATGGTDYSALQPKLTVGAGNTAATYTVKVFGDRHVEKDETVRISVFSRNEDLIVHKGLLTIRNDD